MHTRKAFHVTDSDRVFAALREYGLVMLVSTGLEGELHASRAATIIRRDRHGRIRILSHLDRRNPQLATFADARPLLAIASGPDAYVSPQWYSRHPSVPSWNHVTVHVHGRAGFFPPERPELTQWLLRETVADYEGRRESAWTYDPPKDFHNGLASGVCAFEIIPTRLEAAFKLSQDKPPADRDGVINALSALPDTTANAVARLMAVEADGAGIFNTPVVVPTAELPEHHELVAAVAIAAADA